MLEILSNRLKGRVLILGVENPLRGDDGAGSYLIQQLNGRVNAALLDCGEVLENFLGKIAESQPPTVSSLSMPLISGWVQEQQPFLKKISFLRGQVCRPITPLFSYS